jgi:hypothetical protein
MSKQVILYSKPDCCLCDDLKALLQDIEDEFQFLLVERNIEHDLEKFDRFRYLIPVLDIENGPLLYPPHSAATIRDALQSANYSL